MNSEFCELFSLPACLNPGHFTVPDLENVDVFNIKEPDEKEKAAQKYGVYCSASAENYLYINREFKNLKRINLSFSGTNNHFLVGKALNGGEIQGEINVTFKSDGCRMVIGDWGSWLVKLDVIFYHKDQIFFWGKGATSNGTRVTIQFPGQVVGVGDDCMFASDTCIRNSDMHGIYDLATREKINSFGSVLVQPHVWLGQYVYVAGASVIGYGSIVGLQSLVKGDIEPCSLYLGTPARKRRDQVTWDRNVYDTLPERTLQLIGGYRNEILPAE